MVDLYPEYDLLWRWIQDALVRIVIEDADVNILNKALLREWQRTPLVQITGVFWGFPPNPNLFKMAPARRKECQLEGCDYVTTEGLTTQEAVLKDLDIHMRFHELTLRKEPSGDVVDSNNFFNIY